MGTNYYLVNRACNYCSHCGRSDPEERVHIGKSSMGWCFSLHITDEIKSLDDWKSKFDTGIILNEYEEEVAPEEMLNIITNRARTPLDEHMITKYYRSIDHFLTANSAQIGPNNLLRSKIDGRHCVGHGEGTWDLIAGDFS